MPLDEARVYPIFFLGDTLHVANNMKPDVIKMTIPRSKRSKAEQNEIDFARYVAAKCLDDDAWQALVSITVQSVEM